MTSSRTLYNRSCDNTPVIRRMNFVNAELAKISVNTFVTTKISYANMLADICDRLPGADVDVVTQAIGTDSRVGSKHSRARSVRRPLFSCETMSPLPCSRDRSARVPRLPKRTDAINRYQIERVLGAIDARCSGAGPIGVLGLAYKPRHRRRRRKPGRGARGAASTTGVTSSRHDPKALAAAQSRLRRTFRTSGVGGRVSPPGIRCRRHDALAGVP